MPSESEIRGSIRKLITESHRDRVRPEVNTVAPHLTEIISEEELKRRAEQENQQRPTHVPHLNVVQGATPFTDQVAELEGLDGVIETRVQQAYDFREFFKANTTDRQRKELLMTMGVYQPTRREKLVWQVSDRIQALKQRVSRVFPSLAFTHTMLSLRGVKRRSNLD